jgi:hypothetical protein
LTQLLSKFVVYDAGLVHIHVGVIEVRANHDFVILGILRRHKLNIHEAKGE